MYHDMLYNMHYVNTGICLIPVYTGYGGTNSGVNPWTISNMVHGREPSVPSPSANFGGKHY